MELKKIIDADYLDIIYDNRNKLYGGYELRKNYEKRMMKGLSFLFLGLGAVVSLSFVSSKENAAITRPRTVETTIIELPHDIEKPKVVTPPPPAAPAHPQKTVAFTPPRIVPPDVPIDNPVVETKTLSDAQPGPKNTDGVPGDAGIVTSQTGNGAGPGVAIIAPPPPMVYCEQMPQFIGDIREYISKNIHYPDRAREANIEGRIIVQFVVNEDGTIGNATILRGLGYGCDEEALHMLRMMPKWKPGKQNGKAVRVFFTLPIQFVLQ